MSQNLINHWQLSNKEVLQDTSGNLIINGWMDIWQRGATTSASPNLINSQLESGEYRYRADRFACWNGSDKIWKADRSDNVPSTYGSPTHVRVGVPAYSLRVTPVNTSGSVDDVIAIEQPCEGSFARNFYGKTCTLRFWVLSSAPIGSVFSVYIRTNEPTPQAFVTSFTTTSNTNWREYSVVVTLPVLSANPPADPSARSPGNYNDDIGITIGWVLASNNTFETSNLNVWTNSDVYAASTQSNFMASTAYLFYLTCVEFRVGDLTKDEVPYGRRPYTQELELCQRYFEKSYDIETTPGTITSDGAINTEEVSVSPTAHTVSTLFMKMKRMKPEVTWYSANSGTAGMIYVTSASLVSDSDQFAKALNTSEVRTGYARFYTNATYSTTKDINNDGGVSFYEAHWIAEAEL